VGHSHGELRRFSCAPVLNMKSRRLWLRGVFVLRSPAIR